ncbi:hypothetical protein, conserved in T. vivax [Trypanosoma vivax Y486]|uniref:Retrotransposon hot spot (RHS) protein n=1 Tax=Trypanosoma vivax (strain Y486) TaxID=1055687 RepID=F9WSS1_TRYVY|nr:hypothetical protein, conserved in T. vivax [Trypanosoma vivax Y486]|eukprot:CCD20610.1 hypothetical protein, conserved in T. vivax [Trypanosoma vivax Y486]
MSSAGDPNDEPSRRRARSESDVAVPEQSAAAPTAPSWSLDTKVKVVLLEGAAPPADVKLSAFLRSIGEDIVPTRDVSMSVFVWAPQRYIPDEEQINAVLNAVRCLPYELFYKVAPFLERKAISSLRQWAESGRGVRPSPSDNIRDHIWNVATARLNAAVDSIKRYMANEAALVQQVSLEERVAMTAEEILNLRMQTSTKSVRVMPGAFESVFEARWGYVESGHVDMPLGLKIYDGTVDGVVVPRVWPFDEVREISCVDELELLDLENDGERDMAAEHERNRVAGDQPRVEVFVLTSPMGWPYTKFIPTNARYVFVRREMVRVWHVVEHQIQMWPNCTHQCTNEPYVLVGTPGIGKSLGCGSYLLYELLHYDAAKVPIVAYFVRGSAYIFHKTGAMAGQVVFYEEAKTAVSVMDEITADNMKVEEGQGISGKMDGYIIFDVSGAFVPYSEFLLCRWGCIALSSPNTKNFADWKKQNTALPLYINCYSRREIMAFHAFQERCVLRTDEEYVGAREQIELDWTEIRTRIREVGPLPRYIFDEGVFDDRLKEVEKALESITESDMERYVKIFFGGKKWIEDGTTHKIIRLVWSSIDGHASCRNYPASVVIAKKLIGRVAHHFAGHLVF